MDLEKKGSEKAHHRQMRVTRRYRNRMTINWMAVSFDGDMNVERKSGRTQLRMRPCLLYVDERRMINYILSDRFCISYAIVSRASFSVRLSSSVKSSGFPFLMS